MELLNATSAPAALSVAMDPSGRDLLVVVIKATFILPKQGDTALRLSGEQVPLMTADVFSGDPGTSAPLYEADFAAHKPHCDVLLNGTAYAPRGEPATHAEVGLAVGRWAKSFSVVGPRVWQVGTFGVRATAPVPFRSLPIGYDVAFGGTDHRSDDPSEHGSCDANPVGRGFHKVLKPAWIDGTFLPSTEVHDDPVKEVGRYYRPMALAAIGRHWEPRRRFAGTYDDAWRDQVFPFLPDDFDDRYYQSAPPDQQIAKPTGGELVTLLNLTPDGRRSFQLPGSQAPVHLFLRGGGSEDFHASIDTLLIEPDDERVVITWRLARPFRRDVFEVRQVLVGSKPRGWWRARKTGKTYYSSLADIPRQSAIRLDD